MTQPDTSTAAATGAETAPEPTAVDTAADTSVAGQSETEQPKPSETLEFWRAKAREHEKRAKANAAAAAKLDELTAAQEREHMTMQERIEAEAKRADAAEREATALRTAREIDKFKEDISKDPKYAGIPAHALRGSSTEEIEEHAAILRPFFPLPPKPGQVPAEGRAMQPGTGDPSQQFAEIVNKLRRQG